jgi:hypothetical protein
MWIIVWDEFNASEIPVRLKFKVRVYWLGIYRPVPVAITLKS